MKAVVYDRYGPPEVLRLAEVPKPEPRPDELLVKVQATTVNRTDAGLRSAEFIISRAFTGLLRPRNQILAMEFSGVVDAIGADVTGFKVADEVVDSTSDDFPQKGQRYDVIFDAVGKTSFLRTRHSLKRDGNYLDTAPAFMFHIPLLVLATRWTDTKVKMGITSYAKDDLLLLRELMEAGTYRAVIDRTYPLEDVVEATRYVEAGHKTGNVVLTVAGS